MADARAGSTQGQNDPGSWRARIHLGGALGANSDRTVAALYALTLLLVGIGLIMVLSSSSITSYLADQGFFGGFWKQATFAFIGIPLMLIAAAMPLNFWKKWSWLFLAFGILLQMLVFTPLGIEEYGNRNWIQIGAISGQPSEALKLAFVVWIGAVMLRKEKYQGQFWHEVIPVVVPGGAIVLGSVLLGHDLGTVIIMAAMMLGAMFFGGTSYKTLGIMVSVLFAGMLIAVFTSSNRMNRILSHSGGTNDYSGVDWQATHGMWALAAGGFFGVGLGNSKAKWSWLPAADNDYIFAIIGEELGFIGALLVILIFIALTIVMLRLIGRTRDRFGRAVVGGILVWIVGQAFVNIGVVIGVFPVLGVPLPLISAGGTALIACLMAMGVVISIARDSAQYQQELAVGDERLSKR